MKDRLRDRISSIVDSKLSAREIDELIYFLRRAKENGNVLDDEDFYKDLTYEMTGQVKELAMLIIEFKKDLKSRINPDITDIATKYIPETADQLKSIIEATEKAADRIMDNLEAMQEQMEDMKKSVSSFRQGKILLPDKNSKESEIPIAENTMNNIYPFVDYLDSRIRDFLSMISDSFIQMSFQDLTGQRIKRIISLTGDIEEKIKKMIISFGIKLNEKERHPDISSVELQKTVEAKVKELSGPQEEGQGLNQADIDELLANL